MCYHHAISYSCGHVNLTLAGFCTQAALIQTPCTRASSSPLALRVEHACPACGGAQPGQAMPIGGLSCERGMKDPRWRRDSESSTSTNRSSVGSASMAISTSKSASASARRHA